MERWDCLEAECMFREKEWSDGQRPGGVSFPFFSQKVRVLLQWWRPGWHLLQHKSTEHCSSLGFYCYCVAAILPLLILFYKTGGVITGCVKMSKHICWSKNVQTWCDSRIINPHLLTLGKQSSPPPGFVCLAQMASLCQRNAEKFFF